MFKKSTTLLIFISLVSISSLSYYGFTEYSKASIKFHKNQISSAQKAWNNYLKDSYKINSSEINHIAGSKKLTTILEKINKRIEKDNLKQNDSSLKDLNEFIQAQPLENINFIAIYSSDDQLRGTFSTEGIEVSSLKLPEVAKDLSKGENVPLDIELNDNNFYSSVSPVIVEGKYLGAVVVGQTINNETTENIKDLSGANTIVFNQDKIIGSSIPLATAKIMLKNLSTTKLTEDINYEKLNKEAYWISGSTLINENSKYAVFNKSPNFVNTYLDLKSNSRNLLILSLVGIFGLSMLLSRLFFIAREKVTSNSYKAKGKIKKINNKLNSKIDKKLDSILKRVENFFEMEFFSHNKEFGEVSNTVQNLIKDYRSKILVNNINGFSNASAIDHADINSKTITMYHSNFKGFNQLIKESSPAKAFNILSICLKMQQDIITKYGGSIVKQSDDKMVAVFESSTHAESAINAASEIQEAVNKIQSEIPGNTGLSVSLASGEVMYGMVMDNIAFFGNTAKIGATLCDEAPAGSTYAQKSTYEMSGVEKINATQDLMLIKGLRLAVRYYKLDQDTIILKEKDDKISV